MGREQEFGERLRGLRSEKGLSLRKAAALIGVSHMRLGELEKGISRTTYHRTRPTPELVGRIATAYGEPKDALLELAGYARERPELSYDDQLLLDLFHEIELDQRAMVLRIVRAVRGDRHRGESVEREK